MKILQLELIAFGLFSNKILEFSPTPGLHILYGANEAGKSTMRRAFNHFFFGIPERTADTYLHANDQLRIGARLLNPEGEELLCYRRKGRKNTLLDAENKALDEKRLQAFFCGIKETQFTALCCFDHDRLRQGGEDLLNGGGDVGESLFEAGTGYLKVHEVLANLDKEKEELFKVRGHKPLLNKKIRAYKEANKRIQESSLSVDKWSKLAKSLDQAQQQHRKLTAQLYSLHTEKHRLERIQRTRPLLQRYQAIKEEWQNLADVILLPDDAASKHFETKLVLRTAQTQEKQAQQAISELENQIDILKIPSALLAQKATIDNLRERLGSYQKTAEELPGVRTEMRTVENEACSLLQRIYPQLDLQDVSTKLAITKLQRDYLNKCAEAAPVLHEKQRNIIKRLDELTTQLLQLRNALEALPIPSDLTVLRAVLARACQYSNLEDIQTKDEQEVRLLAEKAEIGLKQITWTGSLEALEQAALPRMERIEHFDRRFNEYEHDKQRIKEHLLDARQRNERATQKMNALSWAGDIPSEDTLANVRQKRQKYWQQIKKLKNFKSKMPKSEENYSLFEGEKAYFAVLGKNTTLNFDDDENNRHQASIDNQTIQAIKEIYEIFPLFEKSMLDADDLSDRLRREASRVAEYGMLLVEQQSAEAEQEQQTKKWRLLETLLAELQIEWENSWKYVGIKPWMPAEMRGWLNDALSLREQACVLRERRQQLQEQRQLITALSEELTETLKLFIPENQGKKGKKEKRLTRLSDLIRQGNACVNEVLAIQRQRDDLNLEINRLELEQQRTRTALEQANEAIKQWQIDWAKSLTPLHLPPETPPETARNVLNDLEQVLNKVDRVKGLRHRVALMQKEAKKFRRDVAALMQKIAPDLVESTPEQGVPELSNRLSQAEKDLARSEQLQQRLNVEKQRLAEAIQALQNANTHLEALLEQAHCNKLADLEAAEQASLHKKEVQQQLAQIEQQLLEQGEGLSLTKLANAAAEVDIDELPNQLENCIEQIEQLEQERSSIDQSIGERRTLLKQMDGNDRAAQAADEAQLALAEVQNLSERYIKIHLAGSVLRKSIERYREQNQGPLIKRASELFQRLTLDSFCGIKTDYRGNNDKAVLLGLRTVDNKLIPTNGMSDGTRDQLYLALRLASLERFFEKKCTLPLILDDVLINFDDERSKATLSVLGEMSKKTQILFLTHHPHLVALAKKAVPKELLLMHQL